ncbi:NAD(+) synthase [candidate division KSB1 bacterium]|nr:NAD(+) synthase [candidate division KSB1 bacterium]
MPFHSDVLKIDCIKETKKITDFLCDSVLKQFKKRGVVVALSGGIDSSVVGALCVKALGKERVFGLLLPEKDSSPDTLRLSRLIADHLCIEALEEDITPMLEAVGCYQHRDEAIRSIIPEYDSDYSSKIVLPNLMQSDEYRIFSVVVQSPDGKETKARLTPSAYSQIVAATNFKQRIRKMLEYYHADRLNYAVTGTPNRQEYDQGFFVKIGDGAADVKPIAHLYKTQVYELATYLNIPKEIQQRLPTTDTYSMDQSQEEFYFSVPYDQFDLCLYGKNHNIPAANVAEAIGKTAEQIERVYADILHKRMATKPLHLPPQLVEEVKEIKILFDR